MEQRERHYVIVVCVQAAPAPPATRFKATCSSFALSELCMRADSTKQRLWLLMSRCTAYQLHTKCKVACKFSAVTRRRQLSVNIKTVLDSANHLRSALGSAEDVRRSLGKHGGQNRCESP